MKLQLGLEWFLNPDHLPMIAGIELGWYRDAGLSLELVVPDDHYDGLAATVRGDIAFSCNEPLHMIDAPRPGLAALGCFFETDGGILLHRASGRRLLEGGKIRIASPVAGGVTDAIAIEILARWCGQHGAAFEPGQVVIEGAGFGHLENLRQGFDGAWLCFANFEGVEARLLELDVDFICTDRVGLRNFSALELFTSHAFLEEHGDIVQVVVDLVSRGAALCRDDPAQAAQLWYAHSGETPTDLMDAIIADTCPRLVSPVRRDAGRWQEMWAQFDEMGLAQVDAEGYRALYAR